VESFLERALATTVGALFAFGLAWLRQRSDERLAKIEKFKTALFVLILHRTYLRNLNAQQLEPKRDHPIRAYAILDIMSAPPLETFDVQALAFLLGTGEANLLNRLTVAEAKYRSVVALVEARNSVHRDFQAKLEAAQRTAPDSEPTIDELRRIAGKVISSRLEQMTEALFRDADDAILFNRDTCVSATESFKRLFPRAVSMGLEDLPLSPG
jgi:hypothetical protein